MKFTHMKAGVALIVSGIIIIAIGLAWIIIGSPAVDMGLGNVSPGQHQPAATISPVPTGTTAAGTPTQQTAIPLSADEIKLHFIDLAFGAGNAHLERWDAAQNNGRIVISVTANRDDDIRLLESTVREFNAVSRTNQISTQIKEGSTGDITIKFIPESGMGGIPLNTTEGLASREFVKDGVTLAKITGGTIYVNADLKGDARGHTLIRCLLHELGFFGSSDAYPDSLFSSADNTNTRLSEIDKKAIELMYGNSLTPGMSAGDVKSILYIR